MEDGRDSRNVHRPMAAHTVLGLRRGGRRSQMADQLALGQHPHRYSRAGRPRRWRLVQQENPPAICRPQQENPGATFDGVIRAAGLPVDADGPSGLGVPSEDW